MWEATVYGGLSPSQLRLLARLLSLQVAPAA